MPFGDRIAIKVICSTLLVVLNINVILLEMKVYVYVCVYKYVK